MPINLQFWNPTKNSLEHHDFQTFSHIPNTGREYQDYTCYRDVQCLFCYTFNEKYFILIMRYGYSIKCGYNISKRLVKLANLLQLSGHQDISLLSFVRVAPSTLIHCGRVPICARPAENCISVERLNALNADLQSLLQNIK